MKKGNASVRRKIPRQFVLWTAIIGIVILLFFGFSQMNKARIIDQNQNYIQDSAIRTTKQLDQTLLNATKHIEMLAYWFSQTLTSSEVTPEQLQKLQDNLEYDYIRFTDKEGNNMSADGETNNSTDREYYQEGMAGKTGISVTMHSRITGETLVNFYTPLWYDGEIIGVLRGVYLAEERMKDLLESSFFGVDAAAYLCMEDGTIIAGNSGTAGKNEEIKKIEEFLLDDTYVDEKSAEDIKNTFETGNPSSFTYQTKHVSGGSQCRDSSGSVFDYTFFAIYRIYFVYLQAAKETSSGKKQRYELCDPGGSTAVRTIYSGESGE